MTNQPYKIKNDNLDPISGEPGAHPVGTGLGTAAGAAAGIAGAVAAGAAAGTVVGPAGTIAGAVIGGVIGAYAGKGAAEEVNPTAEDAHWRENYKSRPYVEANSDYKNYQSAYRYGVDSYGKNKGANFDSIESDLERNWDNARGESTLEWNKAREASRDAYDRLYSRKGTQA